MIQRSTETRTKGQTIIHKTLSKNMLTNAKIPLKSVMNSCAPEGNTVSAPLVISVVLLLLDMNEERG